MSAPSLRLRVALPSSPARQDTATTLLLHHNVSIASTSTRHYYSLRYSEVYAPFLSQLRALPLTTTFFPGNSIRSPNVVCGTTSNYHTSEQAWLSRASTESSVSSRRLSSNLSPPRPARAAPPGMPLSAPAAGPRCSPPAPPRVHPLCSPAQPRARSASPSPGDHGPDEVQQQQAEGAQVLRGHGPSVPAPVPRSPHGFFRRRAGLPALLAR